MPDPGDDFERLVADFYKNNWGAEFVRERRLVESREVDVIIDTPNELVIIECTIERGKKKAEQDIAKIRDTRKALVGDASHRRKPMARGFLLDLSRLLSTSSMQERRTLARSIHDDRPFC